MSDRIGCTRTCCRGQESSSPECGDGRLSRTGDAQSEFAQAAATIENRSVGLTVADAQLLREPEDSTRMEPGLRGNEHQLHDVLDSILAGVMIVDAQTHQIVDVNPSAVAMIGVPRDRIVGRICHYFVCPSETGHCPIRDRGQTLDRSERVVLRADGTRLSVLKSVVSVVWLGRQYLIESFVDVSSLKQAQEEARESLSLLTATLESMTDALLVVDVHGRIKSYNRQFQTLWRLSDEVLAAGDNDRALTAALPQLRAPERHLERIREFYEQPEQEGREVLEFVDGRIVEYCSFPQRIGERIVGRIWHFRDITEKYTAEQKQAALLRRVAEINEELTHFAYVVSHDLKAPLRGIKVLAEWLCADYGDKLGDEAKEQLALLQSRVGRMHNLIDGVLQYSRVGRIKEDVVPIDLNEVIPGVVDGIAPPEHVRIVVQPGLPVIECERTRIIQVFQNLLGNSIKFMDKPAGEVKVACVEDGEFWRFSVADNGPGIEAKYFDRIFRLFQTLAPRDEFESSGVGLAVVKKIIEMYGGRIWVESEVGRGSTFLFTVPRQKPSPALEGLNAASTINVPGTHGPLD